MKKFLKNIFKKKPGEHKADKFLIVIIILLVYAGLLMLSSASSVVGYKMFDNSYYYFNHQILSVVLGAILFYIFSKINYFFWKKHAIGFLLISCLFLLLVFIPGLGAHYGKANSWINIFGFSLQPAEFVKVSFLIYLAAWLERRQGDLNSISQGLGPFLIILGFISFLMIMQPDIGTLAIIGISSVIVYFVGGGKIIHLISLGLVSVLVLVFILNAKPYVKDRFNCLTNPEIDVQGQCYQINQSLIAVGSGGFWGRGIGQSRQKYMYLPEVSGDSIFSIIAEEVGFVFSSLLIILFFLFFLKGVLIAKHASDRFGQILAVGIVSWIAIQVFLNIGGMINLIPMTGVPLPLISYGGSAMMASLLALGILVNISKYTEK
ncbi:putative lipid II flippase FtsW [bacterium]|nr:putative lipid II flippase FtsW [bacterium]